MDEIRKISKEQIVMVFVVTCIETTTRDKSIGPYLCGDLYVADEFILEMQNRQ